MTLQLSTSTQLRREKLSAIGSPSKPQQTLFSPSNFCICPCFKSHFSSLESLFYPSKAHQIVNKPFNSYTQKRIVCNLQARVYQGFKTNCSNSKTRASPKNNGDVNGDVLLKLLKLWGSEEEFVNTAFNSHTQKRIMCNRQSRVYGGFKVVCSYSKTRASPKNNGDGKGDVLQKLLMLLASEEEIEETLNLYCGMLGPKGQTVVLNEQMSWKRVVRVFEWMKLQRKYLPNVIHYNVVIRALGKAQKWDDLRLCWIDMAKKGIVPTNRTYAILVDVYGKAGLMKEALLWIKHMKLRGIFPDEVTMSTVVRVLKDGGEYDRADRYFKDWCMGNIGLEGLDVDSMVDSESGNSDPISFKHFLLTELFKTGGRNPGLGAPQEIGTSARKPQLTSTYNTLIDLYGKAGRLKDAAGAFVEMLKSGIELDVFTFNTMIFICGSHGHLSEAEALLKKMEERGILPDTKTYNTFLCLYADAGNTEAVARCYDRILEVGLSHDIVTYRIVLHFFCERERVETVMSIIKDMEKSGLFIDSHSLPNVIKLYVNEGLFNQAKSLFEKSQSEGGLSSSTYAGVMDAFAEKGLWAEAESVFLCKRDLGGQKKDILEYNVMIKAYGNAKLYEKAFMLFKGMKNQEYRPDECTYNSIIQMFAGGDLVDHARDLLVEMERTGFTPSCLTFSSLIGSYVRSNRLSDAIDMYHYMAKVGVKPNEYVFGSLINGFAEVDKLEEALHYFKTMEEIGILANQVVLTSLIKAYGKAGIVEGAKRVYEKMKDLEGGPDVVASNAMITVYAHQGIVSEAKLIYDNLRKNRMADGSTYGNMIFAYRNMGLVNYAIEVAEEMRSSGLLTNSVSYNRAMSIYATLGRLSECGEMLKEMLSWKIFLDGGTYKVLFTIMKKGDVPVEAVRQLELAYQEEKPYAKQAIITYVFSITGLHSLALKACQTIAEEKRDLDSFFYNVAIKAYGSSGSLNDAMRLYLKMKEDGVEPDVVTYLHLVECYGQFGMLEGIKRIYNQMQNESIEPNESLYKAIIEAYRRLERTNLADMATQSMKLMFESEDGSDYDSDEDNDSDIEDYSDEYM